MRFTYASLRSAGSFVGERAAPIKAHATFCSLFRAFDEVIHLLEVAGERKGLFDDQWLADIINCQRRQRLVDLATLRIEMDAHKIKRSARFG